MTRIAIRDSTDSYNIDFFDNVNGIKYHQADLEVYAQGSAFLDLKYYSKTQIVDVGMRLAFEFRGKDYWMTVTSVSRESEYEYQVEARSLSLEALREVRSSYKASRNMTFAEYLNVFDPEHSIRLNVNTISDRSRQLEWTGEDTILARILSLATKFDAEIAFETELNDDYSLKEFRLNVHALNELGKDRTGTPFRISNSQLKLIKFKSSIDEFYSAIRGSGKDGITISGLDKKVYDDEGKLLFYTSGGTILAPQARDKFISITNKKTSDGYIVREFDNTQHETKEALYAYMLGELKKHCEPQIDYTIDGYIDADVNDTVLLIDDKYTTDDLMLTARVNKQKWSLIDKLQGNNRTELSNYVRVYSEIADELIARMNALIEANKTYDVQILTTNGYSFKNGFGETTLTARVMDGPKDATNEFNLTWFKNSTEYAHTASINVQAGSIDDLATYLIIAEKDGRERGRNELTVFNVKDGSPGKTPVVHIAWADSADGSVGFSLELPTNKIPKYRGYYVDYSTAASTNPKLYKWERNPDDAAKVADEAKDKADSANNKADSANNKADTAISTANTAKDTADEASKQTAIVNELANTAKELADKANADATEANRLIGLANGEIDRLNTDVSTAKSDLASAEADLNSKIETVKTTLTQNYATKTNLSDTQITLNKTISESVASVKQEMSEKYSTKTDLTTLQGEYNSFKEQTAKNFSQQVSSIQTIQTDTTEAQKLANDAFSKANSAVASATNASSTANSALNKATDASSVANSANQNATNAVANANTAVSTANTAKNNADKAIADVAALTKTVSSQSTKIDQTSNRIDLVASSITEVGNRLDGISIGDENLINLSEIKTYSDATADTSNYIKRGEVILTTSVKDYSGIYIDFYNDSKPETYYVFSYDITALGSQPFRTIRGHMDTGFYTMKCCIDGVDIKASYQEPYTFSDSSVRKHHVEAYLKLKNDMTNDRRIFIQPNHSAKQTSEKYKIENLKIVEGNKYTNGWGPAPSDIKSEIDNTNSNIANNYYQKTTVDSKLSTAVSGITAQYTQDITTKLGNYYDKSTIDSKLTIDGQGITTYVKNTQSQLDNLQVGGRNLIVNSEKYTKEKPWQRTISGGDDYTITDMYFPVVKGQTYTFQFCTNRPLGWHQTDGTAKGTVHIYLCLQTQNTVGTNNYEGLIDLNNSSLTLKNDKYYQTFTIPTNYEYVRARVRVDGHADGNQYDLRCWNFQAEEGTKDSTWQPPIESMATLTQYTEVKQLADRISSTVYDSSTGLTTKVNQLANSYAITALNSAGDILASLNLNANTSTAEINAKLIRLNGSTKMDDAFVNKLVANNIITNKIKATEISGDYIKGGTITGVSVETNSNGAMATLNNGRLSLSKTESVNSSTKHYRYGFIEPNYILMNTYEEISGSSRKLTASTWFDANGFYNNTKDNKGVLRKRSILFNSEGIAITPENIYSTGVVNEGYSLNTGIRLYGQRAYLDLNGNRTSVENVIVSRIVSEPDGNMQIINNAGNIQFTTKNSEQMKVNGRLVMQTNQGADGIGNVRLATPALSGRYVEIISNYDNKAYGITVWQSDQRLKNNIKPASLDSLDKINQLQVRQFDWKSDNVHEDFGLIAQEVEQILPNAVFKVGDYYQVKDSGLIPVLIGAVQRLSNKVNILENIIYNTKGSNLL